MAKRAELQTLKGFRDFLPQQAANRQWLKRRLIEIFTVWGFQPLETPTLESLSLFQGNIGEEEKLFFKFKDRGGRQVALRYDQTVPLCRVVSQYKQQLHFPFKRYQIQPAFRAEKPQSGRFREFLQADADIVGSSSPLADAEVIALSLSIYQSLGFKKFTCFINDRTLLKSIPYQAITSIDKLKKIGQQQVLDDMVKKGISKKQALSYLDTIKRLKPNQTIKTILSYLSDYGFDSSCYQFDPTIARSFSYSSGPIWEIEISGYQSGSVLGGERYDSLIENLSGINIPATGFGLGFDRTLEALQQLKLLPDTTQQAQVLIAPLDQSFITKSQQIAVNLRHQNIKTELNFEPGKLKKQFKYADNKNIPWVIIIGEDEIKTDKLTLKNMATGQQQQLTLIQTINTLKKPK